MKMNHKIAYYFPFESQTVWKHLRFDQISLYSITKQDIAKEMAIVLRSLPFIHQHSRIIDSTACIGGNTHALVKYFSNVYAIELDEARYRMLCHNMYTVFQIPYRRLQCYHGDLESILDIAIMISIPGSSIADILFIDPPWGGHGYLLKSSIDLFINQKPLRKILLRYFLHVRYIAIKVPFNFNYSSIISPPLRLYRVFPFPKMALLILTNTPTPCSKTGNRMFENSLPVYNTAEIGNYKNK